VTLYSSELSNCDNLINLTYLFPKCPQHIFFLKKKFQKKNSKKKKYKYMLGWPNYPISGGRPPRLAWGGVVRPPPSKPSGGGRTTPSGPRGGSAAPWAKHKFECLIQRAAEPPPRPLGWFGHPRPAGLGAAEPPPVA
jgi:hypothetical protein